MDKKSLKRHLEENETNNSNCCLKVNEAQMTPKDKLWVVSRVTTQQQRDTNEESTTKSAGIKEASSLVSRWVPTIQDKTIQQHFLENIVIARDFVYSKNETLSSLHDVSPSKIYIVMTYAKFFEMWTKVPRQKQHYYECFLNRKPCRFVIDIDAPVEECKTSIPSLDFFLHHVIAKVIIPECIKRLHGILIGESGTMESSVIGRELEMEKDFTLLVACKNQKKYSAHIICHHPLIYFENMKVLSCVTQEIARQCARKDECVIKKSLMGDLSNIIDVGLQAGSLRLFGSSKLEDPSRILSECSLRDFTLAGGYDLETLKKTMVGYHPPEQQDYVVISYRGNIDRERQEILKYQYIPTSSRNSEILPFYNRLKSVLDFPLRQPLSEKEQIIIQPICSSIVKEYYREFEVDIDNMELRFSMMVWDGVTKKSLKFRVEGKIPCLFNVIAVRELKTQYPHRKAKSALMVVEDNFQYLRIMQCFGTKCNKNWQFEKDRIWRFIPNPSITIPRWKLFDDVKERFTQLIG